MKKGKLLLSQLNKDSMDSGHTSRLMGGNYCAFSSSNRDANSGGGVCSCVCDGGDYYGSNGLDHLAEFYKATSSWGYC